MDQHQDIEVPHVPEDNESSVIEEEPQPQSRPLLSRRKKLAAAVFFIVFVAAIVVGVALSVKPNKTTPDQNGVVQSNPNGAENLIDAEPSEGQPVAESADEQSRDETPNETLDETPNDKLNKTLNETPQEAPAEGVVDDETLDIIIDVSYSAEHPEDVILDSGYEQREPDKEEEEDEIPPEIAEADKVEINSEDMPMEPAEFDGPVTDFIVTPDVSRITVTTSSTCPNANEGLWKMTLETDNYPWETYWELRNNQGTVVAFGPPKGKNYARATKYIGQMCFRAGQYKLTLGDKNKDGFCCSYGRGRMEVKVNGKIMAESDNAAFEEKVYAFPIRPAGSGNNTPRPTPRPTRRPTPRPTNPPIPPINLNSDCTNVDIKVVTDSFGAETSYKFTPVANPSEVLLQKRKNSMKGQTTYKDTTCVEDGDYRITVTDPFQGIQDGGYYAVAVGGEEVMYGNTFSGGSQSHVIRVGHKPKMTPREREWLDAHNTRRETFHKKQGMNFRKLVWSPQLAEEASNWVDEILPTCKIIRQPGLNEGENMSARTSGGARDEGPEPILQRWSDNKAGSGYPRNQSMTQVMWRASRYVGCSEKAIQRQNKTWCYVTICRYARAGNCSMGSYKDWKTATLTDRTGCGPICPSEGCY